MEDWSRASWFVVFAGIADAYLWGFDVDRRWRLRHGNPARGSLAILPMRRRAARASLEDAVWIADCLAFDHDAPVGVSPSASNRGTRFPHQPVISLSGHDAADWYFDNLLGAFAVAAEIRFGASYCVRYGLEQDRAPGTDFSTRFAGREALVSLYAMACRQADVMTEFLCLYRILEAADRGNGTAFAVAHLDSVAKHDFGVLRVIPHGRPDEWRNAFDVYRQRALDEMDRLRGARALTPEGIASHLSGLRNSLAHGRTATRVADFGPDVEEVAAALPIVKLLARMAIEP